MSDRYALSVFTTHDGPGLLGLSDTDAESLEGVIPKGELFVGGLQGADSEFGQMGQVRLFLVSEKRGVVGLPPATVSCK
jgi:hypothetical protein